MVYVYLIPIVLTVVIYWAMQHRRYTQNLAALEQTRDAGLTEPASLHPLLDPARCIGCGSCISACPEGNVLGLINKKAVLINPTHCIGHGACRTACPMEAITLVFGSEKRGVDIPLVGADFQTNVPGIFIAGELGGMGLIRNAIEQGRQALEAIRQLRGIGQGECLDVVIIGAGPAGLSASLGALQHKLRFVTVEQENLGGTVAHFPRGKLVMTAPATLPIIGKVKFSETTKEALLSFWDEVVQRTGLKIQYQERVDAITQHDGMLLVKTNRDSYRTRAVLLAIGRRGTPRKLDVPGEELSKVVYRLIDPEQYRGQHVLVVGGGDSALEAAASIAEQADTHVTLSYRADAFGRAKEKNRTRIAAAEQSGQLRVLFKSNVKEIHPQRVILDHEGQMIELDNDAVIVSAGGVLPTPFLQTIGIQVDTKHGTA
ncbi:MAG: NAD(P)-binding domain-containing protein [Gammaproteobacteria bacterium]|nr:NAD(P)-binding domain-containing protein [Gammaproteobacteria bacterium]